MIKNTANSILVAILHYEQRWNLSLMVCVSEKSRYGSESLRTDMNRYSVWFLQLSYSEESALFTNKFWIGYCPVGLCRYVPVTVHRYSRKNRSDGRYHHAEKFKSSFWTFTTWAIIRSSQGWVVEIMLKGQSAFWICRLSRRTVRSDAKLCCNNIVDLAVWETVENASMPKIITKSKHFNGKWAHIVTLPSNDGYSWCYNSESLNLSKRKKL